jgi:hypothetical protein
VGSSSRSFRLEYYAEAVEGQQLVKLAFIQHHRCRHKRRKMTVIRWYHKGLL